jgi:putative PIN family toxin of toxin-antitoxin system
LAGPGSRLAPFRVSRLSIGLNRVIDNVKGITYDTKMNQNVVIDTNVLLTALKSARGASYRLLSLIEANHFTLHVSTPLIAEYEAVLKRGQLVLTEQQIDDVLDFICGRAVHHKIFYLWRPTLKDPDDDFLLELAVKADAMIVTWNLADFKRASTFGITAITPRDFLNSLENST